MKATSGHCFWRGTSLFSPRDAMSLCLPNNDEFLNVTVVGGVSGTEAGATRRLTGIEESFPPLLLIVQYFSPSSRAHSYFTVSSPRLVLLACFLLPLIFSL